MPPTNYNAIAGTELGRVSALSDGIFAIAMTLLVLEIHAPEAADIHSEGELAAALVKLAPTVATWLMSLMTLGIFWLGQQTQLSRLTGMNRNLAWLHFLFLAVISALPFSTRLLAAFFDYRLAFFLYYLNILLAGLTLYLAWAYAERAGLTEEKPPGAIAGAVRRRIVRAQALYAIGAVAGLVSAPLGVALIILIQVNYAVAPRWTNWS
jgi:uncharacterized membrane protein